MLRKLCNIYKGKKLADGKPLNGKHRQISSIVDTLQNYYEMAIRSNSDPLVNMVNAVLATLYHVASTVEVPNHDMCSSGENSWCQWNKNSSTY